MTNFPATIGPGIPIPDAMIQRLVNWHGRENLAKWFETIPAALATWCDTWEITLEQRELPDTVSMVLFGESAKAGPIVIKIGPPNLESRAEIAATRAACGPGMVELIDAAPDISLIMLKRLQPGTMLRDADLNDEAATRVTAGRLRAFWRDQDEPGDLTPLTRWTKSLQDFSPLTREGFPNDLVLRAQALLNDMLAHPRPPSLLHGDLHHQNILWQEGAGWITIDPKGLIGERGFDITAWMMNPWGFPNTPEYLQLANRRLDILAEELGEDRDRLTQWVVVFAALSLCWSLEVEQPEDPEGDIGLLVNASRLLPD
jgi:streptomycin 6-kinase